MLDLECFVNDKYKVLKVLYDCRIRYGDEFYTVLPQLELAEMLQFSRPKINKILQELKEKGFIDNYKDKKRKYVITDKGYKVIDLIDLKAKLIL